MIGGAALADSSQPVGSGSVTPATIQQRVTQANPEADVLSSGGRVRRIYGTTLATGNTPEAAGEAFCEQYAQAMGVELADLKPQASHLPKGQHIMPAMYDPASDDYRFHVVNYSQYRDGIKVFRSRLTLLVRNEANHPVVLANPDVRQLGNFEVDAVVANQAALDVNEIQDGRFAGGHVLESNKVIWAGVNGTNKEPRLADRLVVENGIEQWLVVLDSETGELLYDEMLIYFGGVSGEADGNATDGVGAAPCEPEVMMPLPFLQINSGGTEVFAGADGSFSFPAGTAGGTFQASLTGEWFFVNDDLNNDASVSVPANNGAQLVFNDANNDEGVRAQVNAYVEANRTRQFALTYNPDYPTLDQGDFQINVNRTDGFCPGNAWYSSFDTTINFCLSGGGHPNTSFASVIQHEFGHHLVEAAGSGQGAYGEGMSDTVSALMLQSPLLGLGFFGDCDTALRNADNDCQYQPNGCSTCGSGSHACGQLLSGCVWDMYEALQESDPNNAVDIASNLTINSILMHTDSSIEPGIAIDFLTLDDDDDDIGNGTPHAAQIVEGFSQHNMIDQLSFEFPEGQPEMIDPSGGTTVKFEVVSEFADPIEDSVQFLVDTGDGFVTKDVEPLGGNLFEGTFPGAECGEEVEYYFAATSSLGGEDTFPEDAPEGTSTAVAIVGFDNTFVDDFESDEGWTVEDSVGLSTGTWERGTPVGGGDRGDPPNDADGSGQAYLTENVDGNSDIDGGSTTLISPVLDAGVSMPTLQYSRWYSNAEGDAPFQDVFTVEISDDGGDTWQILEQVGPDGPAVTGGWFLQTHNLNEIDGFEPNDQFRVRFIAEDAEPGSIVEAGVDGVRVASMLCGDKVDPDIDGNGVVDVNDLLMLLADWGLCDGCAADLDGNGAVDVNDLLELLAAWG